MTPTAGRQLAYRLAIPAVALGVYGLFALLWNAGAHSAYFGAFRFLGIAPFSFPYLDVDAVLSAAECRRQGVDIYVSNPCDALGRPHVYSPVWMAVVPGFLDKSARGWIGLGLGLMFILSWGLLLRPRSAQAMLVFGMAALSPMTVFALERANNDIVVFLLILCGGMLSTGARPYRLCAYPLYLAASLLKYYPLVLLILLAQERRRDAVIGIIASGALLILSGVYFGADLGKALTNIPAASYFADSFSAENLPFGMGEALSNGVGRSLIAFLLLAALTAVAIARTVRTVRLLEPEKRDFSGTEMHCLAIGSMLVTACFFAGQNINYRGSYLLLVLPGLVRLHQLSGEVPTRRFYRQMITAVLFVMWEECFRHILHNLVAPGTSQGLSSPAEVLFWLGRELVWWWLIAGLAALVMCYLRRLPLARNAIACFGSRFAISAEEKGTPPLTIN
jgi:hypothetical protein